MRYIDSAMSTNEHGHPRGTFWVRLFFTILFCGLGLWFAITGRAKFLMGGSQSQVSNARVTQVDATGFDAVAIGLVAIALGVINLALGIAGPRRIPVFWIGVAILAVPVLYGLGKVGIAIYELAVHISSS